MERLEVVKMNPETQADARSGCVEWDNQEGSCAPGTCSLSLSLHKKRPHKLTCPRIIQRSSQCFCLLGHNPSLP